jgi:CBS domain-containing protein
MGIKARDVMDTRYHTLSPQHTIAEAVRLFHEAGRKEGKRIFGMMVTDEAGGLQGMLSMYDILLFIRPKHVHIWGEMEDIDLDGLLENIFKKAGAILVGDIMTAEVVTIGPDAHVMMVLDLMIKKHIRRLPVLEDDRIVGMVYISDLFSYFFKNLAQD